MNLHIDKQVTFSTQRIITILGVFQKETSNIACFQQVGINFLESYIILNNGLPVGMGVIPFEKKLCLIGVSRITFL